MARYSGAMDALRHPNCPLCGGPNGCAPAARGRLDVDCWCRLAHVSRELLARVPEAERGRSCICMRCAGASRRGPRDAEAAR